MPAPRRETSGRAKACGGRSGGSGGVGGAGVRDGAGAGGATLRQVTPLAIELAEQTLNDISEADLRAMLTNLERIEGKLRDSRHKPADPTAHAGRPE